MKLNGIDFGAFSDKELIEICLKYDLIDRTKKYNRQDLEKLIFACLMLILTLNPYWNPFHVTYPPSKKKLLPCGKIFLVIQFWVILDT